jgi:hypothetical protein
MATGSTHVRMAFAVAEDELQLFKDEATKKFQAAKDSSDEVLVDTGCIVS